MFLKPSAIAAGCMVALVSFDAGAFPASVIPLEQQSFITQVAGGCGLGWHRGPWGAADEIGALGAAAFSGGHLGVLAAFAVGKSG
jgi:hypothetical protein